MLIYGANVAMSTFYPRKRYCSPMQTQRHYNNHRIPVHNIPVEQNHWHKTLHVGSWLWATCCNVGTTVSLHALFTIPGQVYITYHYRRLQSLELVMKIPPRVMSATDSVGPLIVSSEAVQNILIKHHAKLKSSWNEFHYNSHRKFSSSYMNHAK